MKTIGQVFNDEGKKLGLKVRWKSWGHRHKFFTIESFDAEKDTFTGTLEDGESITYKANSPHWKLYERGDESTPSAV